MEWDLDPAYAQRMAQNALPRGVDASLGNQDIVKGAHADGCYMHYSMLQGEPK